MGRYIQTPGHDHNKANIIAREHGGEILNERPATFDDIPTDKALIFVVDNGYFEAAAYAYSEREFTQFTSDPDDHRPIQYVLIDKTVAEQLC